ncbi:TIM-barrel domain-containing protein [Francisella halioticida]|uniref:TIM-barrel domain-containing protein n=1 Tax=Francisella halioticida TaxID=549298 RepID=UPI0030844667
MSSFFWGHYRGFSGPAPEPELLIHWIQHGIFYPRFTIHSWNDDKSVNTSLDVSRSFRNYTKGF